MKKLAMIGLFMILMFSYGCATTNTPFNMRRQIPPDRIYLDQEKNESKTATIIVTRDRGMLCCACCIALYVDGKLTARLRTKETISIPVEPGEVLLKIGLDPYGVGLCSKSLQPGLEIQRETWIKDKQTKSFRISLTQAGTIDIHRSNCEF